MNFDFFFEIFFLLKIFVNFKPINPKKKHYEKNLFFLFDVICGNEL